MATYSSILAWEIPWTEEPGGLQSMGWQRVVHNSAAENGWTCWWVGFPLTKGSDPLLPPGAGGREEKGLRSSIGQWPCHVEWTEERFITPWLPSHFLPPTPLPCMS